MPLISRDIIITCMNIEFQWRNKTSSTSHRLDDIQHHPRPQLFHLPRSSNPPSKPFTMPRAVAPPPSGEFNIRLIKPYSGSSSLSIPYCNPRTSCSHHPPRHSYAHNRSHWRAESPLKRQHHQYVRWPARKEGRRHPSVRRSFASTIFALRTRADHLIQR
jgi:hypothetical protein